MRKPFVIKPNIINSARKTKQINNLNSALSTAAIAHTPNRFSILASPDHDRDSTNHSSTSPSPPYASSTISTALPQVESINKRISDGGFG